MPEPRIANFLSHHCYDWYGFFFQRGEIVRSFIYPTYLVGWCKNLAPAKITCNTVFKKKWEILKKVVKLVRSSNSLNPNPIIKPMSLSRCRLPSPGKWPPMMFLSCPTPPATLWSLLSKECPTNSLSTPWWADIPSLEEEAERHICDRINIPSTQVSPKTTSTNRLWGRQCQPSLLWSSTGCRTTTQWLTFTASPKVPKWASWNWRQQIPSWTKSPMPRTINPICSSPVRTTTWGPYRIRGWFPTPLSLPRWSCPGLAARLQESRINLQWATISGARFIQGVPFTEDPASPLRTEAFGIITTLAHLLSLVFSTISPCLHRRRKILKVPSFGRRGSSTSAKFFPISTKSLELSLTSTLSLPSSLSPLGLLLIFKKSKNSTFSFCAKFMKSSKKWGNCMNSMNSTSSYVRKMKKIQRMIILKRSIKL